MPISRVRRPNLPLHICGMSRVCARGDRCRHGMTHDPNHACCRSNRTNRQCICTNFILAETTKTKFCNEFGRTIDPFNLAFGICVPFSYWEKRFQADATTPDIVTFYPELGKFSSDDWRNYRSLETYMGFYSSKLSLIKKERREIYELR